MIVLAIAVKGQEFLYRSDSAHEVSKASADVICKALNDANYLLKDGEVWHKFTDIGPYNNAWAFAQTQKFTRYKNRIRVVRR